MRVDLHTHSNMSDGVLSPADLVRRAKEQHVDVLALTDHDTIAGLDQAKQMADQLGIHLITGIEFSAQWQAHEIHVVGLNFATDNEVLNNTLKKQQGFRQKKAQAIGEYLKRYQLENAYDEVRQSVKNQITRLHFAQYLVEKGKVKDIKAAFKRYLSNEKLRGVDCNWLDISEIIQAIHDAGGVAVLAHPLRYGLSKRKLELLVSDFKQAQGDAIEASSSRLDTNQINYLADLVERFSFQVSCGSDFHGPFPWVELGRVSSLPKNCQPVWQHWFD